LQIKKFQEITPGIFAWPNFCLPVPAGTDPETVAAVNGLLAVRLERHFRFLTAGRAYSRIHLAVFPAVAGPRSPVHAFFRSPALRAAAGIVGKSLSGVKFLFRRGENKFLAAVLASQRLVFKHKNTSSIVLRAKGGDKISSPQPMAIGKFSCASLTRLAYYMAKQAHLSTAA
jgi:hypothetical protein